MLTELKKKILYKTRVSKTTKGGRKMSISVIYMISDKLGQINIKQYKHKNMIGITSNMDSKTVYDCISYPVMDTISRDFTFTYKGITVIAKRCSSGGIKCADKVKPIFEACGIKNLSLKFLGSKNPINIIKASKLLIEKSSQYLNDMKSIFKYKHTYHKNEIN